ncbi:MAG: glycosyltransferase family 39 protein [Planctomycetes bacterium]|nr:glycosyltransferase family 39 protein [Planctomycetota bacterium]
MSAGRSDGNAPRRLSLVLACLALLLLGGAVRVAHLGLRTLRGDEEWFAELVQLPTWSEVEAAIAGHVQAIPAPLFTFVEHLLTRCFGPGPLTLRLLPCLAGLVAPLLLYVFVRRHVPRAPSAALLALVSFSPFFVYWSKDAKPYTLELALFLGQLLLFERLRARAYAWSALLANLVFAALVVGFSYASFFTFPLLGLLAALDARGAARARALRALGYGAALAALLALVYFGWVRHRRNAYLDQFWLYYFAPWGRPGDLLEWHLWRAAHLPNRLLVGSYAGLLGAFEVAVALFACGVLMLGALRLRGLLPLRFHLAAWVPLALCYAASAAGTFPFEDRLLLFALALPLLYFAAGLVALWCSPRRALAFPARALISTALLVYVAWPMRSELLRPATGVERVALQSELVAALAKHGAAPLAWYELATNPSQFYFDYQPKGLVEERWISLPGWFGYPYRARHASEVARWLTQQEQSWAVLLFTGERGFDLERGAILAEVERDRRLVQRFDAPNASAFLFAPRAPAGASR